MGTRHLTMVIQNHETKISQYGQWDGYPESQGVTVLSFLKEKENIDKLKEILPKIRFENEQDIKEKEEFSKSTGAKEGLVNIPQADLYKQKYPLDSRDIGGAILEKLLEYQNEDEIVLVDAEGFAADSLFCEWAYVVDLDNYTLEVYRGFNESRLTSKDRFYNLHKVHQRFYPIKILKTFSLEKLPDVEKFVSVCCKELEKNKRVSKNKDIEQEL